MIKRLSLDSKVYGDEPVVTATSTDSQIINAWNWFNYYHDSDDAKSFVLSYLKSLKKKDLIAKINKIEPHKLRAIGWNCRLLMNGSILPDHIEKSMWDKLDTLISQIPQEVPVVATTNVVSIQDRITARAGDLIAYLEQQIDDFINTGKSDFDVEAWYREQAIKPQVAKKIVDYYNPLYSELYDAYKGSDKELKSAYSHWKKSKLKKYMELIKSIISTGETQIVTVQTQLKKTRKPRKKKEKPAGMLVSKLKFKDKDTNFKINSIKATDVIGAQQLWVFNTKYRSLTVFNAMSHSGLSVKGTTIIGFDEKTSITKKLRKPEQLLSKVVDGGKVMLRNLMKDIKTREVPAKGRINNDVVLLRTVK